MADRVKDDAETCGWWPDEPDMGAWATSCGCLFTLNAGSPHENRMAFCCYCGKPLVEQSTE